MKYTIGIDYGTLSARAVLVQVHDGKVINEAEYPYPNGVIEKSLPSGQQLELEWALQDPKDYRDALHYLLKHVLDNNTDYKEGVIGIGVDFTASTFMPIQRDLTPVCEVKGFENRPNAWPKLWKHHASNKQAIRISELANQKGLLWIKRYGNVISPEWQLPKALQVFEEDRDVYDNTDNFIEAGDWIVSLLTGQINKSTSAAGFKGTWHNEDKYPSQEFLRELSHGFEDYYNTKMNYPIKEIGEAAGTLTKEYSEKFGLNSSVVVAVANIDAHANVPTIKDVDNNAMVAVIGTSTGQLLYDEQEHLIPGVAGVVKDGVVPGYYGYETGQNCVGDGFGWYVDNLVPETYYADSKERGISVHDYLSDLSRDKKPGETGLIALDWLNGSRSVITDLDLSSVIVGMTIRTKPEDIYRSLLESTAYGTKIIIDNFENNGIRVDKYYAAGGIALKNDLMMQIYADVLNMDVQVSKASQGPAKGSAIFAALAAKEQSGYTDFRDAVSHMGDGIEKVYYPIKENVERYKTLYEKYKILHTIFGKTYKDLMHSLKNDY